MLTSKSQINKTSLEIIYLSSVNPDWTLLHRCYRRRWRWQLLRNIQRYH